MILIGRLILGGLCAYGVLLALERLVTWRRPEPGTGKEQGEDVVGGRMPAVPFVAAAGGVVVVSVVLAQIMFGALSGVVGFFGFVIGASIVVALRRHQLPTLRRVVLEAVNEIRTSDAGLGDDLRNLASRQRSSGRNRESIPGPTPDDHAGQERRRPAPGAGSDGRHVAVDRERSPSRAHGLAVPASTIDQQAKQAIARSVGRRSMHPPPRAEAKAAVHPAARLDDQALAGVRRRLVACLRARSAALAIARMTAPTAPPVPVAANADLAARPSAEIAVAGPQHESWQIDSAAQREAWRQDGEAQRRRWREEAEALQHQLGRPGGQGRADRESNGA